MEKHILLFLLFEKKNRLNYKTKIQRKIVKMAMKTFTYSKLRLISTKQYDFVYPQLIQMFGQFPLWMHQI